MERQSARSGTGVPTHSQMNVYEWVRYTVGLWLYEAFEEQQEQQLQPQRLLQLEGPGLQEQGSQEDVQQEDEIVIIYKFICLE